MSDSFVITGALRTTLQNIERAALRNTPSQAETQPQSNQTLTLNTGRTIEDVTDISISPSTLTDKATEFESRLDGISTNLNAVRQASDSIVNIEAAIREADGFANQALQSIARAASEQRAPDPAELSTLSQGFNDVLGRIDSLIAQETGLVAEILNGGEIETNFTSIRNTSLVTQGYDLTSEGLGLRETRLDTVDDVSNALNTLRSAVEATRALSTTLAIDANEIEEKLNFIQGTVSVLEAGVTSLDSLGQNDEGANLLARQAGLLLAESDETLVNEAQRELLDLF